MSIGVLASLYLVGMFSYSYAETYGNSPEGYMAMIANALIAWLAVVGVFALSRAIGGWQRPTLLPFAAVSLIVLLVVGLAASLIGDQVRRRVTSACSDGVGTALTALARASGQPAAEGVVDDGETVTESPLTYGTHNGECAIDVIAERADVIQAADALGWETGAEDRLTSPGGMTVLVSVINEHDSTIVTLTAQP